MKVKTLYYPMAEKSEEEYQGLHLSWFGGMNLEGIEFWGNTPLENDLGGNFGAQALPMRLGNLCNGPPSSPNQTGKVVHYVMEAINQVYRLLNHDLEAFTEKDCASGHLIVNELWEFKMHDSISLLIPSLITELCKQVEVEVLLDDTWMEPKILIFPLKMCVGGDFESFASELRVVKELVAKQSQGPGESSVGTKSYVPQSEFDASQFANLEKAYASLAQSHGELSISHSKIKKREKSRDKFFTRMWKGVKGLWNVLKANKPLPTSRTDEEEDESTT
uniref:Uncharacterized protein n=1 Tax=Solanum tuberosum TaxID=4113 RepID=M1DX14_SOLTU